MAQLEDVQLRRELEWAETSEKIKRYLARISAVEGRAAAREGRSSSAGAHNLAADPTVMAVLKAKFPKLAEGG